MVAVPGAASARRLALVGWIAYGAPDIPAGFGQGFGGGVRWHPLWEALRLLVGRGRVSRGALVNWILTDAGARLAQGVGIDGPAWRTRLRAQVHALVGDDGVVVCPIFPTSAPRHGWMLRNLGPLLLSSYACWVNLAGLPSLAIPVGRSQLTGMPIGVQIVGGPGRERTVLAAGLAVQRHCAAAHG
jgi:Asp-tRNA(Asn)/Glu-tRNA(Gln) amidotransferase A subunit family amidase